MGRPRLLYLISRFQVLGALGIFFFFPLTARAQYRFNVWTTDNGLPQNSVNAVLQTQDGYLWLATNDGLVRSDGIRFTVFNHGNTAGIASNRFTALYEDRNRRLWIGTEEEWLICYAEGIFTSYSLATGQSAGDIRRIVADEQGALWITTRLRLLQWKNGQIRLFPTSGFRLLNRKENGEGNVWWKVDHAGFHYLDRGKIITLARQDGLPNLGVIRFIADQAGSFWLFLNNRRLVKISDGKMTVYANQEGWPPPGTPFIDRVGNLWIGGEGKLTSRIPNGSVVTYKENRHPLDGTIYVDHENNFWFGSGEYGVAQAQRQVITAWSQLSTVDPRPQGLNSNLIYTIFQARDGSIWIGSGGGGLIRFRDKKFTHYLSQDGLLSTNITAIAEDHEGAIWIGTNRGVNRFKDGQLTRFSTSPWLFDVWAILEDRQGNFWFTTSGGLIRYKDGKFKTYSTRDGLSHNSVRSILETRSGALWFGTQGGITRYENDRFTSYTEKDGLSVGQVRALYEDDDGALWIGTYESGLYRFATGRFTRYTTQEGLYNNGVFQILEDERGNFWFSCNLGLYRVRKQELNDFAAGKISFVTSIAYGKKDGMPSLECNGGRQPAGWKTRDGKLWFPTMGGIAIVDPEVIPINTTAPPVIIEKVLLDRQPVSGRGEIRLLPGVAQLEIHYTGLSFRNPERIHFKYRLTGTDSDWVEADTRRVAFYNRPAPGEYIFTVLAANSDGIWNLTGQSLRIVVVPPFWRTKWFLSLVILGVAIIGSLGYRQHIERLKREQGKRLDALRREQALKEDFSRALIASQEEERARLARDLHDDLKNELTLINFAALRHLGIDNLEDHWREEWHRVSVRATHSIDIVADIVQGLRPQILEAGLTIAIRSIVNQANRVAGGILIEEIEDIDGIVPRENEIHLYRIVQECVSNIIRHSQASEAKLKIVRSATGLQFLLHDNGCGFDPGVKNRGFGLANIAQRVQILGGEIEIKSKLSQGTTITIILDHSQNHPEGKS